MKRYVLLKPPFNPRVRFTQQVDQNGLSSGRVFRIGNRNYKHEFSLSVLDDRGTIYGIFNIRTRSRVEMTKLVSWRWPINRIARIQCQTRVQLNIQNRNWSSVSLLELLDSTFSFCFVIRYTERE